MTPHTWHLHLTLQLSSDHRNRSTQSPAQLRPLQLLPDLHLPLVRELVPETQQRVHEREIQAVLGTPGELLHDFGVPAPPLLPCRATLADVRCEFGEGGDREARRIGRGEEGVEPVVEVGEEQDFARGEGVEDGWLVNAIERAGFYFAYAEKQRYQRGDSQ